MAEELGFEFRRSKPATLKVFDEMLPPYGNYGNPLDVTAGFTPTSLPAGVKSLIDDPNIGMLFISFPINTAVVVPKLNKAWEGSDKQKSCRARRHLALPAKSRRPSGKSPAVFGRSSDRNDARGRALYPVWAIAGATRRASHPAEPIKDLPKLGKGTQPDGSAERCSPRRHTCAGRRFWLHRR